MKITNRLTVFLIALFFLLMVGCSLSLSNNIRFFENLTSEDPLYFDKDNYEPIVYDSNNNNLADSAMTADYYKNLNPYSNNSLMPPSNNLGVSYSTPPPYDSITEPLTEPLTDEGITYQEIPPGQEQLYILKSQVVPPVCPACPVIEKESTPPPCPPCARCPKSSFTCKKIPNYKNMDETKLPGFLPRLANGGTHY